MGQIKVLHVINQTRCNKWEVRLDSIIVTITIKKNVNPAFKFSGRNPNSVEKERLASEMAKLSGYNHEECYSFLQEMLSEKNGAGK